MGIFKHVAKAITSGSEPECTCIKAHKKDKEGSNLLVQRYERNTMVDPNCPQGHGFNKGQFRK